MAQRTSGSPINQRGIVDRALQYQLTFRAVEPFLRAERRGAVFAPNSLLLLDHPLVRLESVAAAAPFRYMGEVEALQGDLDVRCRKKAIAPHTRLALTSEIASLARLLASLAINRRIQVYVGEPDPSAALDAMSGSDDERVCIAQPLVQAESESAWARYREMATAPALERSREHRSGLIAWGTPSELSPALSDFLGHARRNSALTTVMVATRARTAPLGGGGPITTFSVDDVTGRPPVPLVLISAPFSPLEHPSLGLSLLRETVRGHRPPIVYLTIPFAECIGASLYDWISNGNPSFKSLVGEWIFGYALHAVHRPEAYLAEVLGEDTLRWFQETTEEDRPLKLIDTLTLAELRSTVEIARACVDDWAAQIAALRPRVVAFTSVFQQHAASLALAKRLKTLDPQIVTLFGGSNCESEMGRVLVESYDFVDVVVSGEAEVIFPEVVARLLDGRDVRGLPGVHADGLLSAPGNTPSPVINDLPYPDYDDFFEQWRRSSIADTIQPRLLFETSRGCWWGEKNHCTFCGLNGESMAFRSKRPERALAELAWLSDRYPGHEVAAVDNILDMKYFPTFVRELAARRTKTALFYEVKANLKKEQVALLREAGVLHLQPGVESLSDHILALMRKGVSALQNIQLIKWCTQFGIVSYWNVLWGFPGETAEDYQRMTTLVPLLTHLTPPSGAGPIRLDRFSPNHFDATRLGLTRVRAARAYSFVYELDPGKLDRLAYFFDFEYANHRGKELEDAIGRLWQELEHWRSVHEASRLVHVPTDEGMLVFDSRPCAVDSVHLLEGVDRTVFERCDQLQGIAALANAIGSERDALDAIERLIARRLLVGGDGRFLTPSLCARTLSRARTDVVD